MMKTYKDLLVWQKAFSLSVKVLEVVESFPKSAKGNVIVSQLIRSVTSIGANIAEGYGRRQGKEMEQFFQYAVGSTNETEYWLNICYVTNFVSKKVFDELTNICIEIIKMLNSFISKSKIRRKSMFC